MCDDGGQHSHEHAVPEPVPGSGLSRRRLLQGAVALAGLAGVGAGLAACTAGPSGGVVPGSRAPNRAGLNSYILGMHLHASASEGVGSMRSQLAQAAASGFDVAWFSEHDWRRRRLLFRPSFSFVPDEVVMGGRWSVPAEPPIGTPSGDSGGELVSTPVSPNDPSPRKASLRVRVTSTGAGRATISHRVDATTGSRQNYNARMAGRTVSIDVLPTATGADGWAEVTFRLSRHPAGGDRPEGVVSLLYRLRSDITSRTVSRQGLLATIDVPVTAGSWQSVTFDVAGDVGRAWPDIDPRDNALNLIHLGATSRKQTPAEVCFGYLRFPEQTGYDALGVEHDLLTAYASAEPKVLGLIGTEISLGPHLNQFGGPQTPYDYGSSISLSDSLGEIRGPVVDFIHAQGGLASINHPFKSGDLSGQSTVASVARDLLSIGAGGADILEVGYADKYGGHVVDHLAVWDTLSRNAVFLTGNGVSDDHTGQNWAQQANRFYTAPWARGRDEGNLLDALARGRVYVGYLGGFGGTLDMTVDDVPMGGVAVGGPTSRTLRIEATGVPSGGAVQVVRGVVDYAGVGTPAPNTAVLASKSAKDLDSKAELALDAGEESFVRLQVVDGDGAVVAFGQPTWLLRHEPPHGVPKARTI